MEKNAALSFDLAGQIIIRVGARDATAGISNRGVEYKEVVTQHQGFESTNRAERRTTLHCLAAGGTGQWVCRTRAQRRPHRAGRGSACHSFMATGRCVGGAGGCRKSLLLAGG